MKTKLSVISAAIVLSLAACGGGGSSTNPLPPVSQVCINGATDYPTCTPPGVTSANLQLTVPVPTYAAASVELTSFNEVNAFRKISGLGLLAQHSNSDVAAKNHANCIVVTQDFSHNESPTSSCFTGVTSADRLRFAGYAGTVLGEELSGGDGIVGVRILMNTIYHRAGLLNQNITDVGIAYNNSFPAPLVMELGYTKKQNNASNFVMSYPVNGQQDIPLSMYPESPNPFPDLSLSTANDYMTKTSSPISVFGEQNSTVAMTSFTLTEAGTSLPLDVRVITKANDVNSYVGVNAIHFVGKAPFKANTTYNWTFVGSMNGVPVTISNSLTTGTSASIGGGIK